MGEGLRIIQVGFVLGEGALEEVWMPANAAGAMKISAGREIASDINTAQISLTGQRRKL